MLERAGPHCVHSQSIRQVLVGWAGRAAGPAPAPAASFTAMLPGERRSCAGWLAWGRATSLRSDISVPAECASPLITKPLCSHSEREFMQCVKTERNPSPGMAPLTGWAPVGSLLAAGKAPAPGPLPASPPAWPRGCSSPCWGSPQAGGVPPGQQCPPVVTPQQDGTRVVVGASGGCLPGAAPPSVAAHLCPAGIPHSAPVGLGCHQR